MKFIMTKEGHETKTVEVDDAKLAQFCLHLANDCAKKAMFIRSQLLDGVTFKGVRFTARVEK